MIGDDECLSGGERTLPNPFLKLLTDEAAGPVVVTGQFPDVTVSWTAEPDDDGDGTGTGCMGVLMDEETIVQATEDDAVEISCPPPTGCMGVLVDEETIVQATENVAVEISCPPPTCMGVLVDEETIVQATEDDAVEISCPV